MISIQRGSRWALSLRRGVAAGAAMCALGAAGQAMAADFEPERLKDGVALPADMPRVYVGDFSIGHLNDGRVHVLDGRDGKWAGIVDSGYSGQYTLSPDRKQLYVATTYMTRHTHGERHDMVEIYDADTLRMTGDVELPRKRAQAAYLKGLLRTSHDGNYLFVQNATPATSISVVDLRRKAMLAEVPSAGCWGIYPSSAEALRFSMLCGDGKLATVTLDESGKVAQRAVSTKFFDSGDDPVFVQSEELDGRYHFVTFTGTLHRADLRGPQAVIEQSVSFVPEADRKRGWRPGGYQPLALDAQRKRLMVGMHPKGAEGTHKYPAREIWTLDLASGKRVARHKAPDAIALAMGQSGPRYLYALNGATSQLVGYELPSMRKVFVTEAVGTASLHVEAP
ncbi:amine dehydrogenase large subunit [Pseudoduganella namucuonensis]|uniref:Methylamine dehydrogenase heavy chain n=1 Tax=Pseudoduganella namucuonensis TaxID=1035707 RepID=A0A1I7LZ48_9BURK|nr:amine dehydrogenase large subunit [Pseudoduganella namucuonensis]SFV14949.1 methylamine dehydrogenase heavy chain [Pseudoduganella namucuonensis]